MSQYITGVDLPEIKSKCSLWFLTNTGGSGDNVDNPMLTADKIQRPAQVTHYAAGVSRTKVYYGVYDNIPNGSRLLLNPVGTRGWTISILLIFSGDVKLDVNNIYVKSAKCPSIICTICTIRIKISGRIKTKYLHIFCTLVATISLFVANICHSRPLFNK